MGELIFVGLGLRIEDMSISALSLARRCDRLYAEFYTSSLPDDEKETLEAVIGKEVTVLSRRQVEEDHEIIESAREERVAFLTAGDPMSATTHVELRVRAEGEGIKTSIVHGVSIFTACASALGLQPYKFGRTVTLPFPEPGYSPTSPYGNLIENKERGLHSLVLLDIREEEKRYMSSKEALQWLLDAEERNGKGLIDDHTLICLTARVGAPDQQLRAGYPMSLLREEMGGPLHTLVLPGKLHFMEARSLVTFAGAPQDILEEDRPSTETILNQ
jgi:diphthine synthase